MQSPCRTPRRISIGTRSPSIVTLRHSLSLNSVPNCVCFNRVEGFFVINESDENWNPMIDRRVVLSKSCLFWRLRVVQDYGEGRRKDFFRRNDFVFPVVYALLPDKSQVTYNRMLAMIKAEYPRFQTAQRVARFRERGNECFQLRVPGNTIRGLPVSPDPQHERSPRPSIRPF
ncbi:hypothetical protein QR680_005649 [Steinernema hermaphroditum]|uniref:Uncharacterized protein n=1 Tax=Steinernema hermaphroditum TaxID=289476 RepID=A0AA39HSV5_9BILA|nr:hypothetical protein QR680_005649 [Steinernema hermaphroditum]